MKKIKERIKVLTYKFTTYLVIRKVKFRLKKSGLKKDEINKILENIKNAI